MLLGVMSDTHDRLPTFRRAITMFQRLKVDAILHAGDYVAPFAAKLIAPQNLAIPTHCIYGNNDGERAGLKQVLPHIVDGPLRIELGGKTIVMHHFIDWLKPAELSGADIVISGHNHKASIAEADSRMLLNPGECCGWVNDRCTIALLDLGKPTPQAQIVEVHD